MSDSNKANRKESRQKRLQKLEETSQNYELTFEDFDRLKLKSFGEDLFQVMEKGLSSVIGEMGETKGLAISLNAAFGNGKTTFLKMFEHFIEKEKKSYHVISINAWESDFYEEPVIAILSEFANWLKKDEAQYKKIIKHIITAVGIVGMNVGSQYLRHKAGGLVNIKRILKDSFKYIKNSCQKEKLVGEKLLDNFNQRKRAIDMVRNEIFSEYTKNSKKLIIIVDELDRTRPDYAVRFLEDIKHFFDIENVAFLVAVNRTQMEATVKCLYGQELNFEGYYRKFFKHEMDLPDPYKQAITFVNNLIKKTKTESSLSKKTIRQINKDTYLSCKIFQLTLREIENFVRIFEMICENKENLSQFDDNIRKSIAFISFFICLYLKRKDVFEKRLKGDFKNVKDFISFIEDLSPSIFNQNRDNGEDYDENSLLRRVVFYALKHNSGDIPEEYKKITKRFFGEYLDVPNPNGGINYILQNIKKYSSLSTKDLNGPFFYPNPNPNSKPKM